MAFTDNDKKYEVYDGESPKDSVFIGLSPVTCGMNKSSDGYQKRTGTICSSSVNIVNTIIGTGILALPAAFGQLGWVFCIFIMILSAVGSGFGLNLLSSCIFKGNALTSYGVAATHLYPKLSWLVDFMVVGTTFGGAASYLMVVGDLMPASLHFFGTAKDSFLCNRHFWIAMAFLLIGAPLTCLKNIDSMRHGSYIVVVCVLYCLFIVILFNGKFSGYDPCLKAVGVCVGEITEMKWEFLPIFKALPTFIFAYCCHYNIFPVCNEIKKPTIGRINVVISSSIFVVVTLYVSFGILGYFTYGNAVDGNILKKYPETTVVTVGRLLVSVFVAFSYPMMTHPARAALVNLSKLLLDKFYPQFLMKSFCDRVVYWSCTVFILLTSLMVALITDNLGLVFSLVGATASTSVSFTFPGFFYWKMFREEARNNTFIRFKRYCALVCGLFGLVLTPTAVAIIFL